MALNKTAISWTQRYGTGYTWNPVHGCTKVSDGCRYCYAERISRNFGLTKHPWTQQNEVDNVVWKPSKLDEPLSLIGKDPACVFVNSMSDIFHPRIPRDFVRSMFDVMNHRELSHVTFMLLTKRPQALRYWGTQDVWTPNIWMGTSVEDERVVNRIGDLTENLPSNVVKFLSVEPLIGPLHEEIRLDPWFYKIGWCIVGGESGPKHRPMPHEWARGIRNLCIQHMVPFYFKQSSATKAGMGESLHDGAGRFHEWHQYPGDFAAPVLCLAHDFAGEAIAINEYELVDKMSQEVLWEAHSRDVGVPYVGGES